MDLSELQWHWNTMGERDPLYAILTSPGKEDRQWDPAEFFRTGQWEIDTLMKQIRSIGFPLRTGRALDFGCGVGRMTQPLCEVFEECYGIDIAPSMIEQAERYNRYGSRCHYLVNAADHLRVFEDASFDFIYSNIVLQHMQPEYSARYIAEFMRLLAPGGLAVFQIPSDRAESVAGTPPPDSPAPDAHTADGPAAGTPPGEGDTAARALPDTAFRAEIQAQEREITGAPGSEHALRVNVRNASTIVWPHYSTDWGHYEIRLGTHWYDQRWYPLGREDDRSGLPQALKPGEVVSMDIVIHMPAEEGEYFVALDLVQETVTWFAEKSTTPDIIHVVVGTPPPSQGETTLRVPRMEMHCVPTEHVLEVVEQAGCTLVARLEDAYAPGYVSYRYFVTKPS